MFRERLIATAIASVTILAAAAAAGEEGKQMTVEEKAVLNAVETMTASLEKGDLDAVMASYTDRAAIMFQPGQAVADAAVARQIFSEFASLRPNVSYPAGHEVYVAGDTAVHIAPWSLEGTAPDGTKVEQGGLSVAVLRRQEDGSWRMVIDNPHGARLLNQ